MSYHDHLHLLTVRCHTISKLKSIFLFYLSLTFSSFYLWFIYIYLSIDFSSLLYLSSGTAPI
ncbi:Conserved hypothetical protein [Clostridium acetobutylicum EA 2018]|uniref:Uncharacterized protein n=1 Tax=Clostridium acetobutylicum (strain ATCC 824 / DSM 792 / JCM 1419 / IAM 19013 / LMG 5710 / NBRC 13948 / NRRL B-527 / VKM B-1787 / 2291 / W) TaxID=272562 RepID=Q97G57_CLOAB|nr:Hypothetical protein CA_C2512 [Clostridium acetobutylicum ATCC 824]ADZ21563.1 Conserved hypothetical protein [Clostridium acetobutylicum EA 2018]AEI32401.1 hypothetical protein SMB_G2547 [Clostridium acetobutylicum DSM 1731]AWV79117.1 hypothetical protein DK921_03190 [Clostridium acetobutylicum]PSM07077.1 hypothetical protein C7T89_03190 [Clostridium sp. NJ4]